MKWWYTPAGDVCVLLSACVGNSSSAVWPFLSIKLYIHGHDGDGHIDDGGDGGAVAEWVGLELRVIRLSIERSWVRYPSGGFRMLGKFVYHTLPKVSLDASSMSEKELKPKEEGGIVTSKRSQDGVL